MRVFALVFGIIFLSIGVAGFVPTLLTNDLLLNIFRVNVWLNFLHILTGFIALIIAFTNELTSCFYFQITGAIYAILALIGFVYGSSSILGIFANNRPDVWLHMIAAISALILGYGGTE